jgi:hypothetical protein
MMFLMFQLIILYTKIAWTTIQTQNIYELKFEKIKDSLQIHRFFKYYYAEHILKYCNLTTEAILMILQSMN